MDAATWQRILLDLLSYGVNAFHITGGEPLLRTDLRSVFVKLKSLGAKLYLNTNATLITDDQIACDIAEIYDSVSVSIDSHCSAEHDLMRGAGTHDRVVSGVKLLSKASANWQAQMVCGKHNISSISKTEKFVRDLGATRLSASIIYDPKLSERDFNTIVAELDKSTLKASEYIFSDSEEKSTSAKKSLRPFTLDLPCSAARGECCIDHAGFVYPCRLMTLPDYRCGNLKDSSFADIWENSEVLWSIRNFDHRQIEKCSSCSFFRLCRGGCRAMALRLTGSLYGYPGDQYCGNKKRILFDRIVEHTRQQYKEH